MKIRFIALAFTALFCIASSVQAQDFSTDVAAWRASVEGTSFFDEYDLLVDLDGNFLDRDSFFNGPIPEDQPLSWGSISQASDAFDGLAVLTGDGLICTTPLEGAHVAYSPNPANGPLNGFNFRYGNAPIEVRVFDGAVLIDSFVTVQGQFGLEDPVITHICWENSTGANVSRIELEPTEGAQDAFNTVAVIIEAEFRFETPEVYSTSFQQLGNIATDVENLIETLEGRDAERAQTALDFLRLVDNDVFWEQPSGERLSEYGGTVFVGVAYAVRYLERIDDPAIELIVEDMLDMLEHITNFEIAYAIENGGRTRFINRAEDFLDLAEIIDEDIDNDFIASLVYRLAWANAFYATQ